MSSSGQAVGCWKQAHLSNLYHFDKHFFGTQMVDVSHIAHSFEEEDGAPAEQGMDACKVPQDA